MNEKLLKVINEDDISKRIFSILNQYPKEENVIVLDKILDLGGFNDLAKSKYNKIRSRMTHILKTMDEVGYGKYVVGRHGKPTRLILRDGVSLGSILEDVKPDEENFSEIA